MKKAVVLLSGGLDSATTLYIAKKAGYEPFCLIFDYGQRHKKEVESAKKVAGAARAKRCVLKIELPWKGSALLDSKIKVPVARRNIKNWIPATYVPARNTIFLSFAMSCAEATGASAIFIGANAIDYSGYPDCRPEYFQQISRLYSIGTKSGTENRGVMIRTPLIQMTKADIIRTGYGLGVPYQLTWSCYKGGSKPCGLCDSCVLRAKGFKEAGIKDPSFKKSKNI